MADSFESLQAHIQELGELYKQKPHHLHPGLFGHNVLEIANQAYELGLRDGHDGAVRSYKVSVTDLGQTEEQLDESTAQFEALGRAVAAQADTQKPVAIDIPLHRIGDNTTVTEQGVA